MIYGARTFVPFGIGLLLSIFFSFVYFDNSNHEKQQKCFFGTPATILESSEKKLIDSSGNWRVNVEKVSINNTPNALPQSGKVLNNILKNIF